MEQPFYADRLRSHGIDVLVPEGADRTLVHDVIYDELVLGVVRWAGSPNIGGRPGGGR